MNNMNHEVGSAYIAQFEKAFPGQLEKMRYELLNQMKLACGCDLFDEFNEMLVHLTSVVQTKKLTMGEGHGDDFSPDRALTTTFVCAATQLAIMQVLLPAYEQAVNARQEMASIPIKDTTIAKVAVLTSTSHMVETRDSLSGLVSDYINNAMSGLTKDLLKRA